MRYTSSRRLKGECDMNLRHEWKHEIPYADFLALRLRLAALMQADPHARNGTYQIRSLYFDDPADTALLEKLNGVNRREKFRLRCYNFDASYILLEKKSRLNGLCRKEQTPVSAAEARTILNGGLPSLDGTKKPLLQELYLKMRTKGLQPKTIVEYTRAPFIFAPGNVRVTLDYNLRTGMTCTDFLNPDCVTVSAGDAPVILEVKWDSFLPAVIRDIVQIPTVHTSSFSKYAACRIYG